MGRTVFRLAEKKKKKCPACEMRHPCCHGALVHGRHSKLSNGNGCIDQTDPRSVRFLSGLLRGTPKPSLRDRHFLAKGATRKKGKTTCKNRSRKRRRAPWVTLGGTGRFLAHMGGTHEHLRCVHVLHRTGAGQPELPSSRMHEAAAVPITDWVIFLWLRRQARTDDASPSQCRRHERLICRKDD